MGVSGLSRSRGRGTGELRNSAPSGRVVPYNTLHMFQLAGGVAEAVGAPATVCIGGLSVLVGSMIFLKNLPRIRELVRPICTRLGIIPPAVDGQA